MSYIRPTHALKYVDGISEDYIYPTKYKRKEYIVDYGSINDTSLVELICSVFNEEKTNDKMLKDYLIKKLAERLVVKLRKKPLTEKQLLNKFFKKAYKTNKKAKK